MAAREVLYRGKRADNGEWVEGQYIESLLSKDCSTIYASVIFNSAKRICKEIISATRGEFTGLTDKNGVKIFEGDIVKCEMWNHGDQIGVITYEPAQYIVDTGNLNTEYLFNCENIEVIGNIFDNSELMGGDENGNA